VEPHEVKISPYVSPSHQRLLAAQKVENEKKRLALLADDFRERALIVMMDGVLEHKWEDEIKKDPPKPECLVMWYKQF
jgi:cilia- and flagella-associated protein 43